jgi:hypothetical protein
MSRYINRSDGWRPRIATSPGGTSYEINAESDLDVRQRVENDTCMICEVVLEPDSVCGIKQPVSPASTNVYAGFQSALRRTSR